MEIFVLVCILLAVIYGIWRMESLMVSLLVMLVEWYAKDHPGEIPEKDLRKMRDSLKRLV